jgi:hypothetical protein
VELSCAAARSKQKALESRLNLKLSRCGALDTLHSTRTDSEKVLALLCLINCFAVTGPVTSFYLSQSSVDVAFFASNPTSEKKGEKLCVLLRCFGFHVISDLSAVDRLKRVFSE